MNRGHLLVWLAFAAIVAVLVVLVGPDLVGGRPPRREPRSAGVVPEVPGGAAPAPAERTPEPPRPSPPVAAPRPEPTPAAPAAAPRPGSSPVEVVGPDGSQLSEREWVGAVGLAGARVRVVGREAWVRAKGHAWARIPAPGPDGKIRVVLAPAAPVRVRVRNADGSPALVPVEWPGPDGRPRFAWPDEEGLAVVDDRASGVVWVRVGGREAMGPVLRLVAGRPAQTVASVDPPFSVTGRLLDAGGTPCPLAYLRGVWPDGPQQHDEEVADGAIRWSGRMSDRLALRFWTHPPAQFEPPWPDPRGPLAAVVEWRLPSYRWGIGHRMRIRPGAIPTGTLVRLRVEPAVLARVREAFGDDAVGWHLLDTGLRPHGPGESWDAPGTVEGIPLRLEVRGEVVPEDHLFASDEPRLREQGVVLSPRLAPPEAVEAAPPPDAPAPPGVLAGTVVDAVTGAALRGVTVAGGGVSAVTNAQGGFSLAGLVPGERIDLLASWRDGADPGDADPMAYAPWFVTRHAVGPQAVVLRFPQAAGLRLRATDGLDGKPLSWVRLVVVDGEGALRYDEVRATVGGVVDVLDLAPGPPGHLHAFAPGLRRVVPVALKPGVVDDLGEVGLVRGGRAVGRVKDVAGAPVAGAKVAAIDDGRGETDGRGLARARDLDLRRATTDAEGRFVLEGLDPVRSAALAVWAPGFAPTARLATWDAAVEAEVAVTLLRGATLRVRLRDPSGRAVSGAAVDLRDARTGARVLDLLHRAAWGAFVGSTEDARRASAVLLPEDPAEPGLYRLGPVEPGPYQVTVQHPDFLRTVARTTVVDPSPGAADNPMGLPLETMEWRLDLQPLGSSPR